MNDVDRLELVTHFGERDRVDGRLLGEALLELYAAHGVRQSVLIRGAEGFGRLHHLRTDRLLALSGDLPVVVVAVDERARVESLVGPVLGLQRRGLVTLQPAWSPTGAAEPAPPGESLQLTVHLGRRQRAGRAPAFVAVCDLLRRHGAAGAITWLGVDGTRDGRRVRARFFGANARVPTVIRAVGERASILGALPELRRIAGDPAVTVRAVQVCKRDGRTLARPETLAPADADGLGLWQRLTVHVSQAAVHDGRPVALELIRRLRRSEHSAGATSLRGIWGFHGDHAPHGDRLLQVRRHVPVEVSTVDTPERIAEAFAVADELTAERGLVTCETVPAMRAMSAERTVGGLTLAHPRTEPPTHPEDRGPR